VSVTTEEIEQIIKLALPGATVAVTSQDLIHFDAVIVAPQFVGLSLVKRQQLIYSFFKDKIAAGEIHALSLKTLTPESGQQQHSN
jgi:acid stress-induced BolA-like protein IbaG/YrbA